MESIAVDYPQGVRQCHRRQFDTLFEGTATEFCDTCEKPQFVERSYLGIPSEGVAKRSDGFRLFDGQLTVAVAVPSPDTDVVDHRVGKADMVGHQWEYSLPCEPDEEYVTIMPEVFADIFSVIAFVLQAFPRLHRFQNGGRDKDGA